MERIKLIAIIFVIVVYTINMFSYNLYTDKNELICNLLSAIWCMLGLIYINLILP